MTVGLMILAFAVFALAIAVIRVNRHLNDVAYDLMATRARLRLAEDRINECFTETTILGGRVSMLEPVDVLKRRIADKVSGIQP